MAKIIVQGTEVAIMSVNSEDYISLTDMLKAKAKDGDFFVSDWLRNRNTVEFLGIWERIYNPNFNYGEFATITTQAGLNSYKINYRIHTDAIKENLIPAALTKTQMNLVYATEADVLNIALFGKTAKQWRDANPDKKGNIRDYADVSQLVCLSNLENLNAHFIQEGIPQTDRLQKLNDIAIHQMKLLTTDNSAKRIGDKGARK